MTVLILGRRFLADYLRNPVNVLLLAVVPVVFVVVTPDPVVPPEPSARASRPRSGGHDRVPELAGEHDAILTRITGAEVVTVPGTVTQPTGQPVPRHAV